MDSEGTEQGISRRALLKRIGAGAAIAWSAPIVSSFGTKAFAGLPGRCNPPCDVIVICAVNRPGEVDGLCGCSSDTEGRCACWANVFCSNISPCTSTADCPAGWRCIPGTGCGSGGFCIPRCGETTSRPARSGKVALKIN